MQTTPLSVLMVGQYVPTSGLTSVLEALSGHLERSFRLALLGLDYHGPVLNGATRVYPDVLGERAPGPVNVELEAILEAEKPDIIFLFGDVSRQAFSLRQLRATSRRSKIVAYTAVDGDIVDAQLLVGLDDADCCVFFSEFGLRQARAHLISSRLAVIPHGVDRTRFFPHPAEDRRRAARRTLFPEQPELLDDFIVLNANRPWLRKRLDVTLDGFAQFAADKPPSVKLFLHHPRSDERERAKLVRQCKRFDISERVLFSPLAGGKSELRAEALNLLYNACDVGINTAMGEGWGLVSFEHAATRTAQIVPRHSACADIWQNAADFLEPIDDDVFLFAPYCRLKPVAAEDLAAKLERIYRDPNHRRALEDAAYARVTRPEYQWAQIAEQWSALFNAIGGEA